MFVVILSNIFAAGLGVGFKKPIRFDPAKMISVADDLIPLAIIVDVFCVAGWDGFELFGLLAVTCAILLLTLIAGTYFCRSLVSSALGGPCASGSCLCASSSVSPAERKGLPLHQRTRGMTTR